MFQVRHKLVLSARWLLLPALFYLAGQFLEGPPYRVIVRNPSFILTVLLLSGLATQFARNRIRLPRSVSLLFGLALPILFILTLQRYYDGGRNPDFAFASKGLGILMGINLFLYLASLLDFRGKPNNASDPARYGTIRSYCLTLYRLGDGDTIGRIVAEKAGGSDLPEGLTLDGFSSDQVIDLAGYWREIRAHRRVHFETDVTIRETIVKFGEPLQLVDQYRLIIDSRFAQGEAGNT